MATDDNTRSHEAVDRILFNAAEEWENDRDDERTFPQMVRDALTDHEHRTEVRRWLTDVGLLAPATRKGAA